MAELNQSSCERITSAEKLTSASVFSKPASSSTISSGVCLSSIDPTLSDPQRDSFDRSFSESSLLTSEPSLFGSFYCDNSCTAKAEFAEEDLRAEVELVSLIAKRPLPRYRLRVDPCTAFLGYKNRDFTGAQRATRRLKSILPLSSRGLTTIPSTESLNPGAANSGASGATLELGETDDESESDDTDSVALSSEQIERILDYFLLCGLRVSQMAHTYEDLEAITHLLEEKQNDLELAAKIGKNLLDKSNELERRLSDTEKKLITAEDTISQLKHDLTVRDNLLQIYSRDHQDDDRTSISSGWISPNPGTGPLSDSGEGFSLSSVNFSHLHQKVRDLEEENYILREERNRLTEKADQLDEHESSLIRDCARQLTTAKRDIGSLLEALTKKSDAFMNQQSEVTRLLTQRLDLENRVKQLAAENEMLVNRLQESQSEQQRLTSELCQMRDKYDECLSLFNEARAEVRLLRKRSRRANLRSSCSLSQYTAATPFNSTPGPGAQASSSIRQGGTYNYLQGLSDDSSSSLDTTAASELAGNSLASDLARTAAKDCAADNVNRLFRAMDQARQVHGQVEDRTAPSRSSRFSEYGPEDTVSSSGFFSGSGHGTRPEPSEKPCNGNPSNLNRPGGPTVARATELRHASPPLHDMTRVDGDTIKRHSWFGGDADQDELHTSGRSALHHGGLTLQNSLDDSLLGNSIPSSDPSAVYSQSYAKLPQRLKLIKPLDGSEVLQQWQRLATPSFTRALFDAPLPGVRGRAGVASNADRRAMSVGAAPATLQDILLHGMDSKNNLTVPDDYSHGDQRHFGVSLPSHLLGDGVRSRSLEHLQASTRKYRGSLLTGYNAGRHVTLEDPSDRMEWLSSGDQIGLSSPFSLTSLVSALLPFSLNRQSENPVAPESVSRSATGNPSRNPSETEPIRIRPRSPPGSRGLLEVSRIGSEKNSVQRVVTSSVRSNSPPTSFALPSSQPPPASISAHTFVRPAYSRTARNTNLSEITEESGSPPKLADSALSASRETDEIQLNPSTKFANGS